MDLEVGQRLALASRLAYRPALELKTALPDHNVSRFSTTHLSVTLAVGPQDVIVAFRGTDELADWFTNLWAAKRHMLGSPGKYHAGFLEATGRLAVGLSTRLLDVQKGRRLWLTGHSLGGAMAGAFAAQLAAWGRDHTVEGVYTFAAPRFANGRAAAWLGRRYQSRYFRFENYGDEVPHVPPGLLGFRHAGERFLFGADGVLRRDGAVAQAHALWGFLRHRLNRGIIADHAIELYQLLLGRCEADPSCRTALAA